MCQPSESTVATGRRASPRWALLYGATLPQLVALAAVEASAPSPPVRLVLRWTLALATFVGMGLWVRANRAAFDLEHWCDCAPQTITIRVIASCGPTPVPERLQPVPDWAEEERAEPALR